MSVIFYKQCKKSEKKTFAAKYSEIDTHQVMHSQYPGFDFWN
jgi:hypothetical protein